MIVDALLGLAVPVHNLVNDPANARRGDAAAIRRSLTVFGQRKPVVVRTTGADDQGRPTGIVIAGNHTLIAAVELGWTEVAAVFVDDDASMASAYALADNRTGELAYWDSTQLADTLRELAAESFDLDALGWTGSDLAVILGTPRGAPEGLDELAARLGDGDTKELWPLLRLVLPPILHAAWRSHLDTHGGDEVAAFAAALGVDPADLPS